MTLRLFEGFGIELEYMIVDRKTLAVRPMSDVLLKAVAGSIVSEVELGEISWSNELVLHVIELKTNGPAAALEPLPRLFQDHVRRANRELEPHGAILMPTGMHPTMNPRREMKLWPHDYSAVYEAYNRIFGCTGHGWANLQSMHINLPFADDTELDRLHTAIRAVLPLLPALAASSPCVEGARTGLLDNRLDVYRTNAVKIPSITGRVVPERVKSRAEYESRILQRMYDDIAPLDPEGVLQEEFLNSRGAIARFERMAVEIRVLDTQEHPGADLAVAALVVAAVKALASERWVGLEELGALELVKLEELFLGCVSQADRAQVIDPALRAAFGLPRQAVTAGDVWHHLAETCLTEPGPLSQTARRVVASGPLARRIADRLGTAPAAARLRAVYEELCGCLAEGHAFG